MDYFFYSVSVTYFSSSKGSTLSQLSKETSPPPSYTKGKWKPPTPLEEKTMTVPEPVTQSFGKGKWHSSQGKLLKNSATVLEESPFRKSSGTVQYWCGSCNRRLASKIVYERHLKSELHFKRTLHERDFEDCSQLAPHAFKKRKRVRKTGTCTEVVTAVKKRARKKLFIRCEVCCSRVNTNLIGKHLISHYHCRKGDITRSEAKSMVLDNIHDIVLQSPFQCACCKFYCNTQSEFLNHWISQSHTTSSGSGGFFWCTFCNYQAFENTDMLSHLTSEEHKEVIAVINRSVPIIIKKINPIDCPTCGEQFLLNVQLRQHCRDNNHVYPNPQSSVYNCKTCNRYFKSAAALAKHQRQKHKRNVFACSVCSLKFESASDARLHRRSSEHRYAVLSKKNKELGAKPQKRRCEHCLNEFDNFVELKMHLKEKHAEYGPRYNILVDTLETLLILFVYRCPHCGKSFTLPQELTVHIRTKSCSFSDDLPKSELSCNQCPFTSSSASELMFHKVLHTDPVMIYPSEEDAGSSKQRPVYQYRCPVCEKLYSKASLRCHIRIHTSERPYVCSECNAGFVRKNNWILHMKNHKVEGGEKKHKEKIRQKVLEGQRPFLCSTCGASFKRK